MNNKLYKLGLVIAAFIAGVACNEEAEGPSPLLIPPYVQFDQETVDLLNDDGQLLVSEPTDALSATTTLTVENPFGTITSDLDVTYTLTGTAVFGTDYTISGATASGGTITIVNRQDSLETGNPTTTIDDVDLEIVLLNDAVDDGEKTLVVTLTDVTAVDDSSLDVTAGRAGLEERGIITLIISDVLPEVNFDVEEVTVSEIDGEVSVAVNLNVPLSYDATVTFTVSGSAVSGTDYSNISVSPIVIPAGDTEAMITFDILDDLVVEDIEDEDLVLTLNSVSISGTDEIVSLGAIDAVTYYFEDDLKVLSFVATDSLAYDSDDDYPQVLSYEVVLSDSSSQILNVGYTITGAVAGVDYNDVTPNPGTLTFSQGELSEFVQLQLLESAFPRTDTVGITIKLNDTFTTSDNEVLYDDSSIKEVKLALVPLQ